MKAWKLLPAALIVIGSLASAGVSLGHCGNSDAGANSHDPFGSCENGGAQVRCAADATDVAGLAELKAGANGAQLCNEYGGTVPITGRATVYTNGSKVVVSVDGGNGNPGTAGWSRLDVEPGGSCRVHLRRGAGDGTYWNGSGNTSNPDTADECV